jgi:4'-phosphopantetheinyl transferase
MKAQTLNTGEVHVWTALVRADAVSADLSGTLSGEELERAGRFHFETLRQHYIFAHAFLREVLGRYCNREPRALRFERDTFGKPSLARSSTAASGAETSLRFNLSHSGAVVMLAVTHDRLIGVDVEEVRPLKDMEPIARAHFTDEECAFVLRQEPSEREGAFFRCWTRKESYIKALGKGLSIPLNSFDTSIAPDAPGRLLARSTEMPNIESWWLSDLDAPAGYAGALTVERGFERLSYFRWE